ncbi:TIGR01777 family oxidoreductase [Glutamicibacter sp. NPDC090743]|uniref:TIGR01777 family oxidoreductase n=1 Tax=Glutamicibacter sp. NPDC090743 TaxID=3364001 RepID=UPI00382A6835
MNTERSSQLPASASVVFDWFSRPGAMQRLLPPWLPLKVIEEAGSLKDGTAVLGLPGGVLWNAKHQPEGFAENRSFVDQLEPEGVRGLPARVVQWRHEHYFEPAGAQCTTVGDCIQSNMPGRQIESMLAYRHRQLADDFAAHQRAAQAGLKPLVIALTGSSGLVGQALCAFLSTGGHRVVKLVRHEPESASERRWNPLDPDPGLLDGCDAVIHLAGASIFGRFSQAHRQAILSSRIEPTRSLALLASRSGVRTFISASAIGFYGASAGPHPLDETDSPRAGTPDFLADVVDRWERAANAGDSGMRRVQIRTGIVLSPRGGMLAVLRPVFSAGLGGPLAGGKQMLSWIGLDDLLDIYHRALWDSQLAGPVNAVAPQPVSNAEFTRALARAVRRPAIIPVPAAAPKLLLGAEGSHLLAMADQKIVPRKLLDAGHQFRNERIELELAHSLGSR